MSAALSLNACTFSGETAVCTHLLTPVGCTLNSDKEAVWARRVHQDASDQSPAVDSTVWLGFICIAACHGALKSLCDVVRPAWHT